MKNTAMTTASINSPDHLASVLDQVSQTMLGYSPEWTRNVMSSVAASSQGYPPYNLLELDENEYIIELACAGFSKDDLSVVVERDLLRITGQNTLKSVNDDSDDKSEEARVHYHHRGISKRKFERSFVLGKNTKVSEVTYIDGILSIKVVREIPEEDLPKMIEIH